MTAQLALWLPLLPVLVIGGVSAVVDVDFAQGVMGHEQVISAIRKKDPANYSRLPQLVASKESAAEAHAFD